MIRMMLLLCAGIFLTLQIGGQDRGQMRFGLIEAARAPARVAVPVAQDAAQDSAPFGAAEAAPVAVVADPAAQAVIVPVSFGTAQPVMQPVVAQAAPEAETGQTVHYVTGQSVNVRSGPSTRAAVVDRLRRGESVTVVGVEANGWARIRVEGDGIDGFMSMSFLSDTAP